MTAPGCGCGGTHADALQPRAVAQALGALVAGIGGAAFPACFLGAMRALAGVELCSVFRYESGGVELVFAEGGHSVPSGSALDVSRSYARTFWKSDTQLMRLARANGTVPVIVRRHASEIADPAYRAACYERAGVGERLSILWPGRPGFIASGYRAAGRERFRAQDADQLELNASVLLAALRQHVRADAAAGHLSSEAALVETLLALDCGLSPREAEVAAALVMGETQAKIAQSREISPATVITYRRRAYGKLGVARTRDLTALLR